MSHTDRRTDGQMYSTYKQLFFILNTGSLISMCSSLGGESIQKKISHRKTKLFDPHLN